MRSLLLLAVAAAGGAGSGGASRPVAKVLALLGTMHATVETERAHDASLFQKMDCWCSATRGEKEAAVAAAERRIAELGAIRAQTVALSKQSKTEAAQLGEEIGSKQKSLAAGEQIRKDEAAAFAIEDADGLATIDALDKALAVLGRVHSAGDAVEKEGAARADKAAAATDALLQVRGLALARSPYMQVMQKDLWALTGAIADGEAAVAAHPATPSRADLLQAVFGGGERAAATGLLAAPAGAATGAATGAQSYNARSGEIYGLLGEMRDQARRDLTEAEANEEQARARWAAVRQALTAAISAAQSSKKDKEARAAEADQQHAAAAQEEADTVAALGADRQVLVGLEVRCANSAVEFQARQKVRSEELSAIADAQAFLSSDDARETFSRTFSAPPAVYSFLEQRKASVRGQGRSSASSGGALRKRLALSARALSQHRGSRALARARSLVALDSFDAVVPHLDRLAAELLRQQADEAVHRDWCLAELHRNGTAARAARDVKEDAQFQLADSRSAAKQAAAAVAALVAEVGEAHRQLKLASEARSAENKTFQLTVSDQRATAAVLRKAAARLAEFYRKQNGLKKSLLQRVTGPPGGATGGSPPRQGQYAPSAGAPGVAGLIEMIIADAEGLVRAAVRDEQEAQSSYAEFVRNSNEAVSDRQRSIVDRDADRAAALQDASAAEDALASVTAEISGLHGMADQLHKSCDFVMKNFATRQSSRAAEIDAIREAKSILKGAK